MGKRSRENGALPVPKKIRLQEESAQPALPAQSLLKPEAIDFPRGGGTSLTAHEVKVSRAEGAREAKADAAREKASRPRQKRGKETVSKASSSESHMRIEHLNYKRIVPGMTILGQVVALRDFHMIVALPNQLLGHVPVTNISEAYTKQLDASEHSDAGDDDDMKQDLASLNDMFQVGQFLCCYVSAVHAAAHNEARIRDPMEKASKRVELSLYPTRINANVALEDLLNGMPIMAAIRSVEDHGYVLDLGRRDVTGFLSNSSRDAASGSISETLALGAAFFVTMGEKGKASSTRSCQMTSTHAKIVSTLTKDIASVNSILPGMLVNALITSVSPAGLMLQILGSFNGTVDTFHMTRQQLEDAKVGSKIRGRVLYRVPSAEPPRFALSILPSITGLNPDPESPEAVQIGDIVKDAKITYVEQEWGVLVDFGNASRGFVHISQLSDDHIVSLSGKSGPYREGTTHTGRLLAYNAFEAMWQLSLKQSTIDRKYLTASDIPVGAVFKGSVKKLTDSALIVTIADGLQAVVYPDHYADIALRHPEKRFKVGSSINCRVLAIDAQNHKIVLTAKKTLVESSLPLVTSFGDARVGITTHGCVRKVLDNGLVIGFYNGTKAFLPNKELNQADKTSFSIGKPLSVTIIGADAEKFRIVVSLDGDQGDAKALEEIRIGELVKGTVREIHQEQAVLMLQPMRVRALLALDHLASQRQTTVDALRGSLKLGETIKDLGVASKNVDKGLVIVKPKSLLSGSKKSLTFESLKIGQEVSGKVIGSTRKGSLVRISPTLVAILHMTDVWDDFSDGNPFPDIGSTVKGKVVALDQGLKQPSITTRLSRMGTSIVDVVDPEIEDLSDITPSQTLRGYVKSITDHGLFVTIGRDLDARIQIKELFDEYIKDWQSHFKQNQLLSGRILSVDVNTGKIEMSLKSKNSSGQGSRAAQINGYRIGQVVDGVIKKIETYGVFIEVSGTRVSGLCHKSEVSDRKDMDSASLLKAFSEGDVVKAKVLAIDADKGRISFGLKPSYFQRGDMEVDGPDELEKDDDEKDEDSDEREDEEGEDEPSENDAPAVPSDDGGSSEEGSDLNEEATRRMDDEPDVGMQDLRIGGGFQWNPSEDEAESDIEGGSSGAEPSKKSKKSKRKSKQAIEVDATNSLHTGVPESTVDYERLVLGSPNSSYMWMRYMSHLLQLSELDKAREVARRALQTIHFREEQEKYNIWVAMLNMENTYGSEATLTSTFHEAARANDSKTIHLQMASIHHQSGKLQKAEALYQTIVKKFSRSSKAWGNFAEFLLSTGNQEEARALLPRSLKSLETRKHIKTILRFAQLEYKLGDPERGRTIMEGVIDSHPKRTDLWIVYIDLEVVQRDLERARTLLQRVLESGVTKHKAKSLFKKWLDIEQKHGTEAEVEAVKVRASEWVQNQSAFPE